MADAVVEEAALMVAAEGAIEKGLLLVAGALVKEGLVFTIEGEEEELALKVGAVAEEGWV